METPTTTSNATSTFKITTATMLVTDASLALALTSSSPCAAAGADTAFPSSSQVEHGDGTTGAAGLGGVGHRFGTVYVGCRRVRPSSKQISKALKLRKLRKKTRKTEDASASASATVEVDGDCDELPRQDEATKQSISDGVGVNDERKRRPRLGDDDDDDDTDGDQDDSGGSDDDCDDGDDGGYYQFPGGADTGSAGIFSSSTARRRQIEEELADLAGEREGVPPVALPHSMMRLAVPPVSAASGGVVPTRFVAAYDEELSTKWSQLLKNSLRTAECLRDQDDRVRKLPYVLEPEPWIRKKPVNMLTTTTTTTTTAAVSNQDPSSKDAEASVEEKSKDRTWFPCQYDVADHTSVKSLETLQEQLQLHQLRALMEAAVVQCLHTNTHLHISCGSKFGCDYLLYEGSRHLFHAFAGVRVVVHDAQAHKRNGNDDSNRLPVPSPYDMTGYVRGLNTAGKLALLATVVKDSTIAAQELNDNSMPSSALPRYRVAIVDLALKKIRATTFRGASGTVTPKMLPKRPEAVVAAPAVPAAVAAASGAST